MRGPPRLLALRPSRPRRAPLWRRLAAWAADGALVYGWQVAARVPAQWKSSSQAGDKPAERLRVAVREAWRPPPPRDDAALAQRHQELLERHGETAKYVMEAPTNHDFLSRVGQMDIETAGKANWTAASAIRMFARRLAFSAGPMILTGGQTPGQMLLGIRVVSLDNRPVTPGQVLVREFGSTALFSSRLLPLPPRIRGAISLALLVLFPAARLADRERRPLEDQLAGTQVVSTD